MASFVYRIIIFFKLLYYCLFRLIVYYLSFIHVLFTIITCYFLYAEISLNNCALALYFLVLSPLQGRDIINNIYCLVYILSIWLNLSKENITNGIWSFTIGDHWSGQFRYPGSPKKNSQWKWTSDCGNNVMAIYKQTMDCLSWQQRNTFWARKLEHF